MDARERTDEAFTSTALPDKLPSPAFAQERKAAVIRAEGESESARLISEATKAAGPGMIELRRIEAAKDIADKMAKGRNIAYLPAGNNMLLGLGTGGQ